LVLLLVWLFASSAVPPAAPNLSAAAPGTDGLEQRTIAGLELTLVKLPKGTVTLGLPAAQPDAEPDESPPTRVRLTNDFWIGATEVTVAQWRYFADLTGHITEAEVAGAGLHLIKKKAGDRQIGLTWRTYLTCRA
jgi:formylglycine-generating enzyme required for sulfatase activity